GAESQVALATVGRGNWRVQAGDYAQGKADLMEAKARLAVVKSTRFLPDLYRHLASAELGLGIPEAAERAAERSLEYAHAAHARNQEAMTQRVLAQIALARGDTAKARQLLESSRARLAELRELAELGRTEAALRSLNE